MLLDDGLVEMIRREKEKKVKKARHRVSVNERQAGRQHVLSSYKDNLGQAWLKIFIKSHARSTYGSGSIRIINALTGVCQVTREVGGRSLWNCASFHKVSEP